jgi:hypothetical protein
MKEWTFKIYVTNDGYSDVRVWLDNFSNKAKARMFKIVTHLEITKDWTRTGYYTPLTGYKGLGEIKFIVDDMQYRPLGCFGPEEKTFTILIGSKEQGDKFNPRGAPDIALQRKKMLFNKEGHTNELY